LRCAALLERIRITLAAVILAGFSGPTGVIRIRSKVVAHARYVIFQLAEVAVPRPLFAAFLGRIGRLRLACASG